MKLRAGTLILVALIVSVLAVFLVWPMAHVFTRALWDKQGFTLLYVVGLFTNPVQGETIATSFFIATSVTVGCVAVALPLAWLFARRTFPGKVVCSGLLLLPMILPPFVGAIGVKAMLGQAGALNSLLISLGHMDARHPADWLGHGQMTGIVLMNVMHLYPILYLNVYMAR